MLVSIQNWKTLYVGSLLPQTLSINLIYTNIIMSNNCNWGFCVVLCTVRVPFLYMLPCSYTHATCRPVELHMKFSFRQTEFHTMVCGCESLNRLKILPLCGLKPWLSCYSICNQKISSLLFVMFLSTLSLKSL